MLLLFAVIFGGILAGRLAIRWRLAFVSQLITVVIWVLLFLLGAEVGADPAVIRGFSTLGYAALVIFSCSVAGSIGAAWLLWRSLVRRGVRLPLEAQEETPQSGSVWEALRGSLPIVCFFVAGCLAGRFGVVPIGPGSRISTYVLYLLMFAVGITLGHDATLMARVRQLDPRLALLPAATAVGTLAGAAVASPFIEGVGLSDSLAVGAGFGYYSLSSVFIADLRGAELATVALLCNVMREIYTLLFAPFVARWFGPLAAVSIGGATTFDTTLPIITRAAGRPYAVVAVFHGCVLDFSVPFLVTFFCSI